MTTTKLTSILPGDIPCPAHIVVSSLCLDSRQCQPGSVFFAYPGGEYDGRDYIEAAVAAGCVAVVYEAAGVKNNTFTNSVPCLPCCGLAGYISGIAAAFYQYPARDMAVVGITGTNGKTTCAYLLAQLAKLLGRKMGVIGTLGCGVYPDIKPGNLTTPDPIAVQAKLAYLRDCGCDSVAMEVSSHALQQGRVAAVEFTGAIYTQLSQDHLDYHADMQSYAKAKSILMTCPSLQFVVYNADCSWVDCMAKSAIKTAKSMYYSCDNLKRHVALRVNNCSFNQQGCQAAIQWNDHEYQLRSPLPGQHNLSNMLAVLHAGHALGLSKEDLLAATPELKAPPARLQSFAKTEHQPMVYVDYAHTPQALKAVLLCLRSICSGKIWLVFGCGGDRDMDKRAQMGAVASEYADCVVLTNDNPRSENPVAIIEQICAGMTYGPVILHTQLNRHQAIGYAVRHAVKDDIVLIAGKGHETQMFLADQVIDHHDGTSIQQWLQEFV